MSILRKYPKKSSSLASRIVGDELVIVVPQEGMVRVANTAGSVVWSLLDGTHTTGDIIRTVADEFDIPAAEAEDDVLEFIGELQERGMVELYDEPRS